MELTTFDWPFKHAGFSLTICMYHFISGPTKSCLVLILGQTMSFLLCIMSVLHTTTESEFFAHFYCHEILFLHFVDRFVCIPGTNF